MADPAFVDRAPRRRPAQAAPTTDDRLHGLRACLRASTRSRSGPRSPRRARARLTRDVGGDTASAPGRAQAGRSLRAAAAGGDAADDARRRRRRAADANAAARMRVHLKPRLQGGVPGTAQQNAGRACACREGLGELCRCGRKSGEPRPVPRWFWLWRTTRDPRGTHVGPRLPIPCRGQRRRGRLVGGAPPASREPRPTMIFLFQHPERREWRENTGTYGLYEWGSSGFARYFT